EVMEVLAVLVVVEAVVEAVVMMRTSILMIGDKVALAVVAVFVPVVVREDRQEMITAKAAAAAAVQA
ncbi:hypothetical protein, partial [Anabaena sp. PCC 7938]|uniref:hypothetical protein n=1 Tax=Anabaena sp. PCC 7938 TaxID=1296340 RepID=UPI00202F91A2